MAAKIFYIPVGTLQFIRRLYFKYELKNYYSKCNNISSDGASALRDWLLLMPDIILAQLYLS